MRILALVLGFGLVWGAHGSPVLAQEISGNFAGGSVKVGNDTATCDAARYGSIRFNTNVFQGCSTGGWVNIGTFGGGITALTGEVTASGAGSVAATIAPSAVTNAKMANMAANTLKGNNTGAAAAPVDVTVAQLRTMLGATGTPGATTFLRGDGQWIAPPSGADNLGDHIATTVLRSDTHNTDDLGTTAIRWKDGWFAGTVTAGTFAGSGASLTALPAANLTGTLPAISGANLTSLNASNLASGTIPDARLTGNYSGLGTVTATSFAGSGASLTALNATNLASGTVPAARLPAYTGDVTKAAGGTALTLSAGAVDLTHMSATGTKNSTTFLRGDNTWAAPAGGGIGSVAIVSQNLFRQKTTISCPAGTLRVGCNHTTPSFVNGGNEESFGVRPTGTLGCECAYNTYNTICYALCAQ